jgi:hypothetical protein
VDWHRLIDAETPQGFSAETEGIVSDNAAALKITEFGFAKD